MIIQTRFSISSLNSSPKGKTTTTQKKETGKEQYSTSLEIHSLSKMTYFTML